jgi:cytochrome c biogenesis protein CcdA
MDDIKLNVNGPVPPVYVAAEPKRGRLAAVAAMVVPAVLVVALLFGLISMQRGIETGMSNLARLLPIGFAVAAGMVATVNPCGMLMLPSYALFQASVDQAQNDQKNATRRRVLRALAISAAATGGFVSVFAVVGAVIAAGGQWLTGAFPFAGLAIGAAMAVLGGWLLVTGKTLGTGGAANRLGVAYKRTLSNAFLFGISYAAGSLSCTLPIFLVVVGGALGSDSPTAAFGQLLGYALGMSSVLVVTIVGIALFQQAAAKWLWRASQAHWISASLQRVSALFLIAAGGYLVYYWIFVVRVFGL